MADSEDLGWPSSLRVASFSSSYIFGKLPCMKAHSRSWGHLNCYTDKYRVKRAREKPRECHNHKPQPPPPAPLPRPQEEEETDKPKQAQTEQTYEKHQDQLPPPQARQSQYQKDRKTQEHNNTERHTTNRLVE